MVDYPHQAKKEPSFLENGCPNVDWIAG